MPALPVHHTPTTDRAWDGPATVAALPNDAEPLFRYVFAWYDGAAPDPNGDGYPDAKSGWKFPHHGPTAGSAAVVSACRNGMSRMSGANVDDKPGIMRHLMAHLRDASGG